MALTSNTTHKLTNKQLSIQISLNGLSFCVLNQSTNTITALKKIDFSKKLNPIKLLEKVENIFKTEKSLQDSFDSVTLIHENELSTLVPKQLFNEDALADYLKFNAKIFQTDFISFDETTNSNAVSVYVPYVNINNYIYDKFGAFTFKHISTILIENILEAEKHTNQPKVYINVNTSNFELVVVNNNKLVFYNTFEYVTKQDFIYYILFTAEQLQLNPEVFNLVFVGDIDDTDEFYKITYKYVRNVSFGNSIGNYNFIEKPKHKHSFFTLIKSF